jgi:hypothetical protein
VTRRQVMLLAGTFLSMACGACGGARIPEPSSTNELPFGYLDSPKNGETVGRTTTVTGWAMDDNRAIEVRVYVNGHYVAHAMTNRPRPDVSKKYPRYAQMGHPYGWSLDIDLGQKPGEREVLAQAVDDVGATRDIGTVVVYVIGR